MSYVKHVIQPGERIVMVGHISWVAYHRAIFCVILGAVLLILEWVFVPPQGDWRTYLMYGTAAAFGLAALVTAARAWFIRWTTEIAVTDKRIIFKRGFINRHTAEMNMDKVASVDVDQSLWGRVFDYGSVHILGTGGVAGIEHLHGISNPIGLRNAIDVR
ncbi:MAG TPA: PH domain-containing protein [Xanthobacteraceae bacterium]|jgi:uncharacterized membrane protein YdbT with pleckstrin-like domain|nr:PH domain-containing protein [Xanthobacteraceae bacterium]